MNYFLISSKVSNSQSKEFVLITEIFDEFFDAIMAIINCRRRKLPLNKYKLEKLVNQHKTFDLLQIYFNICPWVKISPKILFSFQKSSHYEWGGLQNYFPVGYRRTFIVFHQFHWTDWQFLVGGQKFKTACPESVSSFTACPCNIWYSKSSQTFTLWFFSNYI